MEYTDVLENIAKGFDIVGVLVLIAGFGVGLVTGVKVTRAQGGAAAYRTVRRTLGGSLLLGLEVLVAGDLIRTVSVSPTLTSVFILGIIVLIRTLLSFSIDTEIEGVLPWRKRAAGAVDHGA